ncbi:uncharacterized protein LOC108109785 [Drosophila eugracilis]|uniref:uncharacterized protein LOC108109785 n=1 Tax=Drosophila eugracilis TaxID=29029 RepID=UPI0007E5D0AE|nr:uncharacterized protein LOC108109785 [Drosophila eugracilis]
MKEMCLFLIIDIALYWLLMPDLPIWAFLLYKVAFIFRPLDRFALVIINAAAKWYLLPFCEEWIVKHEQNLTRSNA